MDVLQREMNDVSLRVMTTSVKGLNAGYDLCIAVKGLVSNGILKFLPRSDHVLRRRVEVLQEVHINALTTNHTE
jgi:hypothetical protein